MITLSNNTKGLALLHQVEKIYGKIYTSESLMETVLYWGINCIYKTCFYQCILKISSGDQIMTDRMMDRITETQIQYSQTF